LRSLFEKITEANSGGGGGIRTHEALASLTVFKPLLGDTSRLPLAPLDTLRCSAFSGLRCSTVPEGAPWSPRLWPKFGTKNRGRLRALGIDAWLGAAGGALKILVAVGAPDEGQAPNRVLDLEGEMRAVLDAVERASRLGNAQVRLLEVGHSDEIRRALTEDAFDVLHLSWHGSPSTLELETGDGAPCPVGAAVLARRLLETGRPRCHWSSYPPATAATRGPTRRASPRACSKQGSRGWCRCRGRSRTPMQRGWPASSRASSCGAATGRARVARWLARGARCTRGAPPRKGCEGPPRGHRGP
jgi:hypothetical protein